MIKPVIFIDVDTSTPSVAGDCLPLFLLNASEGYFDIELHSQTEEQPGKIKIVKNGFGSGVLLVEIERPVVWIASFHSIIFEALKRLFRDILVMDYMHNQIGAYHYTSTAGTGLGIATEVFKEPIVQGFGSTLTGIETKDPVHSERLELKADQFRTELGKLSLQIDTLEGVKERLPTVYETDYRAGLGIGYIYGDLHFYVNLVDGEADQAAVLHGFQGEAVGIFFYENVFVTKQQMIKQKDIELSMLSPGDFCEMLENYSDIAEAGAGTVLRRRSTRSRDGGSDRDGSRRDRGRREGSHRGR